MEHHVGGIIPPVAKQDRTIERLDALAALKNVTDLSVLRPALIEGLADRTYLVVAKAAGMAMKHDLRDLAETMIAAFDRSMENAAKTDRGCSAKTAIAEALVKFNGEYRETYLRGLHHVQLEPVWGGSKDTAAKLRGLCALGLVALGYKDILYELVDLLFDADPEARLLACRALGGTGVDAAALLLRSKLAAGKDTGEIYGECFASLLSLQPNRSIDYIAKFLNGDDVQLVEAAALTIGASRHDRAFALLEGAYSIAMKTETKASLLLSMAMTRNPLAVDLLLAKMADPHNGGDATAALRIFRNDPATLARIEAKLADLNNQTLSRRWRSG